MARLSAVVDRAVRFGRRPPLAEPGDERALGRGGRARPRVVERQERGRAAKRRGHRVLEESVRLGVGSHARVGVDVDRPWEDQQSGGIDHLVGDVASLEVGFDRADLRPSSAMTSARRDPVAVTTVPPRIRRLVSAPFLRSPSRRSGCPARLPRGSAGRSRGGDPASPRPGPPSRSGWRRGARPSTPSCTHRTGRRSRTR